MLRLLTFLAVLWVMMVVLLLGSNKAIIFGSLTMGARISSPSGTEVKALLMMTGLLDLWSSLLWCFPQMEPFSLTGQVKLS